MARFRLGNAAGNPYTVASPNQTAATMALWEGQHNASVIDQLDSADFLSGLYPIFNVKAAAYDAKADGTDDTSAIQAALDAANSAGGGIVFFPAGTYTSKEISMGDETSLVGVGIGLSILKLESSAANGSHSVVNKDLVSGNTNLCFRDLTIDGNKAATVGSTHQGIKLTACVGANFYRVESKNCTGSGFVLSDGCVNYTYDSCWSHDNDTGGFYEQKVTAVCQDGRYVACLAENNKWGGFQAFASDGTRYTNCIARGNVVLASFAGATNYGTDSSLRMTYDGCLATGGEGGGFSNFSNQTPGPPASSEHTHYIGCHAYNLPREGLYLRNVLDTVVTGCNIHTCGTDGAPSYAGVRLQSEMLTAIPPTLPVKRITFTGCNISENGREGMHIQGATDVTISGCTIMNNSAVVSSQPGIRIDDDDADSSLDSSGITIVGNRIGDDQGVATQSRALNIMNGTNAVYVRGNDMRGNAADPITYTTFTGSDLRFTDNAGVPIPAVASATSMDPSAELDTQEITGTAPITTLGVTHAYAGRRITLRFTNGSAWPALTDGNNILLSAATFTAASDDDMITLETDGTSYREISRSVN